MDAREHHSSCVDAKIPNEEQHNTIRGKYQEPDDPVLNLF